MRIAQITLPSLDNDGNSLDACHTALKQTLAKAFGGYTAYETSGGWFADDGTFYEDDSTTYHVAIGDQSGDVWAHHYEFRELAETIGRKAGQLAMFIVFDGFAEVIDLAPAAQLEG